MLAHAFLNFLLDERIAYDNFVNFERLRAPADRRSTADALIVGGRDPRDARDRRSCVPSEFLANQELLQLTVEGERLWDQAWSQFKAGMRPS